MSARRELPEVMSSVTLHASEPVALPHMNCEAALAIAAPLRAVECVTLTFELCVTINAVSAVPLAPETALAMEAESVATVGRAEEDATNMEEVGGDVKTIIAKQETLETHLHKRMDRVEGMLSKTEDVLTSVAEMMKGLQTARSAR